MINKILPSFGIYKAQPTFSNKVVNFGNFAFSNPIAFTGQDTFERTSVEPKKTSPASLPDEVYKDSAKYAKAFRQKLEEDMMYPSVNEIRKIAREVANETGRPEQQVYDVMKEICKYSNYKGLQSCAFWFMRDNINGLYDLSSVMGAEGRIGVNYNEALKYVGETKLQLSTRGKNIFAEKPGPEYKKVFIIDENSLGQLRRLKETNPKKYETVRGDFTSGKVRLYVINGTNIKIGDKYYSYDALGKNAELKELTKAVFEKYPNYVYGNFEHIDDEIVDEFKSVIEDDNVRVTVLCASTGDYAYDEGIVKLMSPTMPSERAIRRLPDFFSIFNEQDVDDGDKKETEDKLIRQYLYEMCCAESPESMRNKMVEIYNQIEEKVKEQGKTMDDVLYLIPKKGKSFDLVNYQYQRINNIPNEKFITHSPWFPEGIDIEGKTIVVLDDFTGSGNSLTENPFNYHYFLNDNADEDINIIFAPLVSLKRGKDNVEREIDNQKRNDKDTFITTKILDYDDFASKLSTEDLFLMDKLLMGYGHNANKSFVVFPYGQPDNNSGLGSVASALFVQNEDIVRKNANSRVERPVINCIREIFERDYK